MPLLSAAARDRRSLCSGSREGAIRQSLSRRSYPEPVTALGALSQSWVIAEASLPLGWRISGPWRFDAMWVALSEGPDFEDYLSGSGQYADQALRRLAAACGSAEMGNGVMPPRWIARVEDERRPADAVPEEIAARWMGEGLEPGELAARHAQDIASFSCDEYRYLDPALDIWIQELGRILFSHGTVDEARRRNLTDEERRIVEKRGEEPW
jgi:hypothetical protein